MNKQVEDPKLAVDRLSDAILHDRNSVIMLVERGDAYLALERADEALADYDAAIALNAKELSAHLKRFSVLLRLDRTERMLDAANEIVAATPGQSIGYFHVGIAYFRLGRDEESVQAYTKAIELTPRNAFYFVNRSATYSALGLMEKSLADCEQALALKPKTVSALINKAVALRCIGQQEKAIAVCNEAIRAEPDAALAYCNRAMAHFVSGRTKQAFDDIDLSIRFAQQPMYVAKCKAIKAKFLADSGGGGNGENFNGPGHSSNDEGNGRRLIEEARVLCDSAVRMVPENSHPWRYAWSTSALISAKLGDYHAANNNVQLVLDRSKHFIYGANIKARILLMQNRLDEALAVINSALSINSKDPESNYIRYLIRNEQQDPAAKNDLDMARKLGYLRGSI